MKKPFVLFMALLSVPLADYVGTSFHYSVTDTAEAYFARRTAVVARGPRGGVAIGARRTAVVVRPGYYPPYGYPCTYPYADPNCYYRSLDTEDASDSSVNDAEQQAPNESEADTPEASEAQ